MDSVIELIRHILAMENGLIAVVILAGIGVELVVRCFQAVASIFQPKICAVCKRLPIVKQLQGEDND